MNTRNSVDTRKIAQLLRDAADRIENEFTENQWVHTVTATTDNLGAVATIEWDEDHGTHLSTGKPVVLR